MEDRVQQAVQRLWVWEGRRLVPVGARPLSECLLQLQLQLERVRCLEQSSDPVVEAHG